MHFHRILVGAIVYVGLASRAHPTLAQAPTIDSAPESRGLSLRPVLTSQDAGFFDLISFRGEVFAGTYHDAGKPALVYRIAKDVTASTVEARIEGAESVYVFAKDSGDKTLILNTERAVRDDQQTGWVRNNVAKSWSRINDAPSWIFGLGAGFGVGRLWLGNNNGDVWWSEDDGASWPEGPRVPPDSTAVGFIEFSGKLYAGQIDWKHADSHLYRLSADKTKWETVPLPAAAGGKRWWSVLGKRSVVWRECLYMPGDLTNGHHNGSDGWAKILRMDKSENIEIVLDVEGGFVHELAVVTMADGVERLCAAWSNLWSDRANGLRSRLYCSADGAAWVKCAEFDEPFAWGITNRGKHELFVGTMGVRNTSVKGRIYYQNFRESRPDLR